MRFNNYQQECLSYKNYDTNLKREKCVWYIKRILKIVEQQTSASTAAVTETSPQTVASTAPVTVSSESTLGNIFPDEFKYALIKSWIL